MIRLLLLALFQLFACTAAPVLAADVHGARILYINSYHRGYSWSDGIEQGLRERLEASGKKIEMSVEYLDSRRFAYSARIEPLASSMSVKYADYRPDLLIVSDNAAFDFAIKYRARLFPNVPIVFCGYNNFRPDVLDGIRNVTGVNEEISIEDTVDMALKAHPDTHTLAFIVSTGDATSKRIAEIAEATAFPKLRERFEVVVLKDASVDEIRTRLAQLPRQTLLFLSGQARDQGDGRALTPAENGSLITAVSPFPSYTFWDFHLNRGVIGGHILTGLDQGRSAADLALRILDGTPADAIPVLMTSPTTNIFDYLIMERFGIHPKNLPVGATIINRPFSVWETYRWQIVGVVTLLILETLLILLMMRTMRERRKALADLAEERALLEQRVEVRTAELTTANEKLELLSFSDDLTQLANRRRFSEMLAAEFQRLSRSGKPLSLIMLDVDFFKNYNDTHGHVAGDACLQKIGALIGEQINRAPDLAARYGGEEFAIILPETDEQGATVIAERIRCGIAMLGIPHAASTVADYVTVSLGVTTVITYEMTLPVDVIKLADEQLYRAKESGRNRVAAKSLNH